MSDRAVGEVDAGNRRAALAGGEQPVAAATGDVEYAGARVDAEARRETSMVAGHRAWRARVPVVVGIVETPDRFELGRGVLVHARDVLRGRRRELRQARAMVAYDWFK